MPIVTKHSVLSGAAKSTQHVVWSAPAIEAGVDGVEYVGKRCEVAVVRCQAPGQFPNPLDRGQLRTVWRQEQQAQNVAVST